MERSYTSVAATDMDACEGIHDRLQRRASPYRRDGVDTELLQRRVVKIFCYRERSSRSEDAYV